MRKFYIFHLLMHVHTSAGVLRGYCIFKIIPHIEVALSVFFTCTDRVHLTPYFHSARLFMVQKSQIRK